MEDRFAADFGSVRIHTGSEAASLNRELSARAFTVGNDIYFNEDQYRPNSENGKRLLAHELTHTIQQRGNSSLQPMLIQRDLLIDPTSPDAVPRELTPDQIAKAIKWNQAAFSDPTEIALLRDMLGGGLSVEPAVIDADFIKALVNYQALFGLTQDGLLGSGTAQKLADELKAGAEPSGPRCRCRLGDGNGVKSCPAANEVAVESCQSPGTIAAPGVYRPGG